MIQQFCFWGDPPKEAEVGIRVSGVSTTMSPAVSLTQDQATQLSNERWVNGTGHAGRTQKIITQTLKGGGTFAVAWMTPEGIRHEGKTVLDSIYRKCEEFQTPRDMKQHSE